MNSLEELKELLDIEINIVRNNLLVESQYGALENLWGR